MMVFWKVHRKWLVRVLAIFWVVLLCIPALWGTLDDWKEAISTEVTCSSQQTKADQSFTLFDAYRLFFWSGRPKTEKVVTLALGRELATPEGNPCRGRALMASLLNTLNLERPLPSVIAVDKYYRPHVCDDEPAGTSALQAAIRTSQTRVVLGAATEEKGFKTDKESCLCKTPSLDLTGDRVYEGFVRLNSDALHIPLAWRVHADASEDSDLLFGVHSYGFAARAAALADPSVATAIAPMVNVDHEEHPFARLEPVDGIDVRDYLCAKAPGALPEGVTCEGNLPQPPSLAGKVVVIGSEDPVDLKPVLDESVYGFQLHARYVAALLGGAYMREYPVWPRLLILLMTMVLATLNVDRHGMLGQWRFGRPGRDRSRGHTEETARSRGWPGVLINSMVYASALLLLLAPAMFHILPPLGVVLTILLLWVSDLRLWTAELRKPEKDAA